MYESICFGGTIFHMGVTNEIGKKFVKESDRPLFRDLFPDNLLNRNPVYESLAQYGGIEIPYVLHAD